MKHTILVSATEFEILPFLQYCENNLSPFKDRIYQHGNHLIHVVITGVGIANTTYTLTKYLSNWGYQMSQKADEVIQAGIAGAFNRDLTIGEVVEISAERWGDLGVSEADGRFTDIFEMGLAEENAFPYQNGCLNQVKMPLPLKQVKGITVNRVTGTASEIAAMIQKYTADVESMEGAAFYQVCLLEGMPFRSIRSISNYVEPRDKNNWNIPLAIDNLNKHLIGWII